jgi:hypothetical protein
MTDKRGQSYQGVASIVQLLLQEDEREMSCCSATNRPLIDAIEIEFSGRLSIDQSVNQSKQKYTRKVNLGKHVDRIDRLQWIPNNEQRTISGQCFDRLLSDRKSREQ